MKKIHSLIAKKTKVKFQNCKQHELSAKTEIWVQHHSDIDLSMIKKPVILSHIVRDFREVVVSGYQYHKHCKEIHVKKPGFLNLVSKRRKIALEEVPELNFLIQPKYQQMSYQNLLNHIDQETGLTLEICIKSTHGYKTMKNWDYNNPNYLEIKFEDFMNDFENHIKQLLKYYEIDEKTIHSLIKEIIKLNPVHWKQEIIANCDHVNKQSIVEKNGKLVFRTDKWKDHFTDRHKQLFKERYNDLLLKLGYEKDDNW